jgi:hypothetical protein
MRSKRSSQLAIPRAVLALAPPSGQRLDRFAHTGQ